MFGDLLAILTPDPDHSEAEARYLLLGTSDRGRLLVIAFAECPPRGMAEVDWEGAALYIGDAIVYLDSLRGRCPMTTVDPDTLERDPEVLRDIARRFGGRLALNAGVLRPGTLRVGDPVTWVPGV